MSTLKIIEGDYTYTQGHFGLIASRFNSFIVDHLISGALDVLHRHGITDSQLEMVRVPGAFEMPLIAQRLAATRRYDGLLALGAIIRGGTPHFDYVAGECAKGLALVSLQQNIPIGFGVLTVDSIEQAIERAGTKAGNKGAEAALSLLEMVSLVKRLAL